MVHSCPVCIMEPLSHSFTLYQNIEHINIYYSRPSSIADRNTEGMMNHIHGMLSENADMKWVWVVDFTGFSLKDMLYVGMYIKLVQMICDDTQGTYLRKIVIINHNFFTNSLLKIMYPFVSKRMRDVVMIVNL
jgi:hypothetical protein